ncbi:tyrosine-type recombinase/integrase [Streptomyces noursei]|nr:tyrosine-type recombinase/integrase [Streptomyces noursei]
MRYRILIEIVARLGLRQGEVFGLALEDIDFTLEVIHVRRQVKIIGTRPCFAWSKGKSVREVPLPPSVAAALQRHIDSRRRWEPVPVRPLTWVITGAIDERQTFSQSVPPRGRLPARCAAQPRGAAEGGEADIAALPRKLHDNGRN